MIQQRSSLPLTKNYQRWMSTAELNSNGESDKKPAKEKDAISHTVEAVVHLWSLGVLTAAGCGIGSVHAVVRSNLLVEHSKVEEGEM
ncbi:cysteine protease [Dorcoceras hygrometricum]|uniref:Cysteine protease n=1 Tax=Dorcoceras hygrometricum TaxID=472368 RepID=A0A2Z7CNY5_9LAMI|nr:cysteine protease [Dorcoceras hygrometricum]